MRPHLVRVLVRRYNAAIKEATMPETSALSSVAMALFRLHVERRGQIAVDDSTREPYRELARAGLMRAGSTFRDGEESIYKLTQAGYEFSETSPSESASPRP